MIEILVYVVTTLVSALFGAAMGACLFLATVADDRGEHVLCESCRNQGDLFDELKTYSKPDYDRIMERAKKREDAVGRVLFNARVNAKLRERGLSVSLRDEGES